jgi:hypothetical protein
MGNYDLTGLSTGSFENLIQALFLKVLGGGGMIFGAGPDGGREATYEGRVDYPSPAERWEGYIIAQAKFRQRLTDKETDGEWAIKQLRGELDKYAERKSGRRAPDYYIFATNVVLSPVQSTGGKDRLQAVFDDYADTVPLRGWAIWDYDQITSYLDAEESIRHAFTAFITPGDVLAEVMNRLQPARSDFQEVMTSYLARELNAAKFADLEQTSETKIFLSRVFVDLPLSEKRTADPPSEEEERLEGVVAVLLEAARERLDRRTLQQLDVKERNDRSARFVLIGGPGQGKTTVGQFACQMFRTAILKDRPRHLLSDEVLAALDEMLFISAREDLELPKARRFPLHVVLRDFASAVGKRKEGLTLFSYLMERIRMRTSRDVTADDFREWLRVYPWLLVLDGLDEVPSSSNRSEVLQAIEEFWIEAAQVNADLLMVATTRPQDYQDDFSRVYYAHRWLVPLSPDRAIRYGKRLVEMRHSSNPDKIQELTARLEVAAQSEATARLMRTPLQVTIMTTLVEQVGRPPQDKWRLFREYYSAIYRRERERSSSDLLGRHQSDIDAIHYRTGLELQILAGSSGSTDARLTQEQFEKIVRERLVDQGHENASLDRLVKEIITAAATRLVFIVGLDVNSIGFEIRSLQEFMAGEAIIDGRTEIVQRRLHAIAGASSWRNVFIFAAGHCFAETESLIDSIHAICQELNNEATDSSRAIHAGSLLALDLLEDAAVAPKPKHARLLARTALELLESPPSYVHDRLGAAYTSDIDAVFRELIGERLGLNDWSERLGAWRTLGVLMHRGVSWAGEMVEGHWPAQPDAQIETGIAVGLGKDQWIRDRISEAVVRLPIRSRNLRRLIRSVAIKITATNEEWWFDILLGGAPRLEARYVESESFALSLFPIDGLKENSRSTTIDLSTCEPTWLPTLLALRIDQLDASSLASLLDETAASGFQSCEFGFSLPWPISAMLFGATPEILRLRATALRNGEYGDRSDWLAAEKRWETNGFAWNELREMQLPWPPDIAIRGLPYLVANQSVTHGPGILQTIKDMKRHFEGETDEGLRPLVADALLFLASVGGSPALATVGIDVLMEAVSVSVGWLSSELLNVVDEQPDAIYTDFVDRAGMRPLAFGLGNTAFPRLFSTLARHPRREGILRVVAATLFQYKALVSRSSLPAIDIDAFQARETRAAVARINVVAGNYVDAGRLARTIATELPEEIPILVRLIQPPYRDIDEALLVELARETPRHEVAAHTAVIHELENIVKSKPGPDPASPLWKDLGLA